MTVRNNKGKITQYTYGDDNIDPCKVEGYNLGLLKLDIDGIYKHYTIPYSDDILKEIFIKKTITKIKSEKQECNAKNKEFIEYMIEMRDSIMENIFKGKNDTRIHTPIAFEYINNIKKGQLNITQNSMVDITPLETYSIIEKAINKLDLSKYCIMFVNQIVLIIKLFKTSYYYFLSP